MTLATISPMMSATVENGEEIGERLERDPADRAEFAQPRDAGDDGQEDHRRDDHPHQFHEAVAQRLERCADVRPELADDDAQHDRDDHLEIEMGPKGPGWRRNRSSLDHRAAIASVIIIPEPAGSGLSGSLTRRQTGV
jgi:hypothetical protein